MIYKAGIAFLLSSIATVVVFRLAAPYLPSPVTANQQVAIASVKQSEVTVETGGGSCFAEFDVSNLGGRRLLISVFDRDCQCFFSRAASLRVAPGATETLKIPIPQKSLGQQEKFEYDLHTNDRQQRIIPVEVNVRVNCPDDAESVLESVVH